MGRPSAGCCPPMGGTAVGTEGEAELVGLGRGAAREHKPWKTLSVSSEYRLCGGDISGLQRRQLREPFCKGDGSFARGGRARSLNSEGKGPKGGDRPEPQGGRGGL